MANISASVGTRGINHSHDVVTVQTLLNAHLGRLRLPTLKVDGKCGPRTIGAIVGFQKQVMQLSFPDGLVEAGGRTLAALMRPASTAPCHCGLQFRLRERRCLRPPKTY